MCRLSTADDLQGLVKIFPPFPETAHRIDGDEADDRPFLREAEDLACKRRIVRSETGRVDAGNDYVDVRSGKESAPPRLVREPFADGHYVKCLIAPGIAFAQHAKSRDIQRT